MVDKLIRALGIYRGQSVKIERDIHFFLETVFLSNWIRTTIIENFKLIIRTSLGNVFNLDFLSNSCFFYFI